MKKTTVVAKKDDKEVQSLMEVERNDVMKKDSVVKDHVVKEGGSVDPGLVKGKDTKLDSKKKLKKKKKIRSKL